MITRPYSGPNLHECVIRFMCALDVFAVSYTRNNALWCAAEIQAVVGLRTLGGTGTIQAEQPRSADTVTTRITRRIPTIPISPGKCSLQHSKLTHQPAMCTHVCDQHSNHRSKHRLASASV